MQSVHYRIMREEPCLCNGHAYLIWLAQPGEMDLSNREMRLGREVFLSSSPMLLPWLHHRLDTLNRRLRGLESAASPDMMAIRTAKEDIRFLEDRAKEAQP